MTENILIQVDDSQIDEAIAKLEEALSKTEQLTGRTAELPAQNEGMSLEETLGLPKPNGSDAQAQLNFINQKTEETKQTVEDAVAQSEQKLDKVKEDTANTQNNLSEVLAEDSDKTRGLEYSIRRITSQVPILREAEHIAQSLRRIDNFGLTSIGGAVGLLFLAITLYNTANGLLEEQKKAQQDYQRTIMQTSNFTTKAQFNTWQANQQRGLSGIYRSGIIP